MLPPQRVSNLQQERRVLQLLQQERQALLQQERRALHPM